LDFIRLAIIETKRNSTRTVIAVLAAALAALTVILLRFIPQGYAVGMALPERSYVGGDILVFPGFAPISSAQTSQFKWRPWPGSDWQSQFLYFFPNAPNRGYLVAESGPQWRAMDPSDVVDKLKRVPGIASISLYRSLQCLVKLDKSEVPAILRGWEVNDESGYSFNTFMQLGRPLDKKDDELLKALVPSQVKPFDKIKPQSQFQVFIPKPLVQVMAPDKSSKENSFTQIGVNWDLGKIYTLTAVGGYKVEVGQEVDEERSLNSPDGLVMVPVYWERPEILVPMGTFENLIRELGGSSLSIEQFPVYQIAIKVSKMSKLKECVNLIRESLGTGYGIYSVPELLAAKESYSNQPVILPDTQNLFIWLIFMLSGIIVCGNIYVLLSQQRRKIGLLRVVGATSKNIMGYALAMVASVTTIGTLSGFLVGKALYLIALIGSDLTIKEWLAQAASDLFMTFGLSLLISLSIGIVIAFWASKMPCSEVLNRE